MMVFREPRVQDRAASADEVLAVVNRPFGEEPVLP